MKNILAEKELFAQQAIQKFDKLNEVYAEERESTYHGNASSCKK